MELISRISLCFLVLSFLTCSIHANPSGFSLNLIHRDSPLSPYYNSSNTYYQNLRNSICRSMSRTRRVFAPKLATSKSKIQSSLTADPGEYLMKISVGTPPVNFLAIADTGSDVTWIQCKPCTECYEQKAPLFDPKKSSTYKKQHCNSINCHASGLSCDDKQFCTYSYTYGDGSFSAGDMSSDSFTFESTWGKPVVLPKITFGCGHSSGGNFDNVTDGIVGLGNSDLSIINQLSYTINGKFAYCMVPVKVLNASEQNQIRKRRGRVRLWRTEDSVLRQKC